MSKTIAFLLFLISTTFLLIFWVIQFVDLLKRDFPEKTKWIILLLFLNIPAAIYYYSKVKPGLASKVKSKKTPPLKKGGLISKPVNREKIKKIDKEKIEIKKKSEKKKTPKKKKSEKPKKSETKSSAAKKKKKVSIPSVTIEKDKAPKPTGKKKTKGQLKGYGHERKYTLIEKNAQEPPVKGRKRVHYADKIEKGENGLLITYGLHRFEMLWDDIFLLVGGQAPEGVKDSLMFDLFSKRIHAPYRILQHRVQFQQFIDEIKYNIDDNFRDFIRFIFDKIPDLPTDPYTKEFISDDEQLYSNRYRNIHEFNQYVWNIRSQVLGHHEIDEEEQKQTETVTKKAKKAPKRSTKPNNDRFAIILKEYDEAQSDKLVAFLAKIHKCSPQKAKRFLKTPAVIAKNVTKKTGFKISKKISQCGGQAKGIPMNQYLRMKKKRK